MNIQDYIKNQSKKELCRFITCGSVDDGKSTLIGRLLFDNKLIFDKNLDDIDFASLVDGLESEQEQGITIDVAYRFFESKKRKFIIADTPGHEQYTKNMATGASNADIAIILIDALKGVSTQTKRHSYIVSLLGIKNIIIAVNKMDLINYDKNKFEKICKEYKKVIPNLKNYKNINFYYIPISALNGDNIIKNSPNLSWHKNNLMNLLNTIKLDNYTDKDFIFAVEYINKIKSNLRGYCGNISSGKIKVNDDIIIYPQNKTSKIKSITGTSITNLKPIKDLNKIENIKEASKDMAVSLFLQDEIDISRGDIISTKQNNIKISNNFNAYIIWMSENKLDINQTYLMKRAHFLVNIKFENIIYKKDINNFKKIKTNVLNLNDIALCSLKIEKNIALKAYEENQTLGSFIIIDKYNNETLAAGMIEEILQTNQKDKIYTKAEIELNKYIRKHYPEWECKKI